MKLAILGAGSWGTALTIALESRFGEIALWARRPEQAAALRRTRENAEYLPGHQLPPYCGVTHVLADAVRDADVVIGVTPAAYARAVYRDAAWAVRPDALAISATKGFEAGTLKRMSELMAEEFGYPARVAVLSGPTFAKEVASGDPAAIVVAAQELSTAQSAQGLLATKRFRLYANADPIGVEVGAALKNVIAIGAGVAQGLGLGSNAQAALVTRGLAEITRLAVAMGGESRTLAGLAGLGDLHLTCSGALSRNRAVGVEIAKGRHLEEITSSMRMVAEGVGATASGVALAEKYHVDMPIIAQMNELLEGRTTPEDAIEQLMLRNLKLE